MRYLGDTMDACPQNHAGLLHPTVRIKQPRTHRAHRRVGLPWLTISSSQPGSITSTSLFISTTNSALLFSTPKLLSRL